MNFNLELNPELEARLMVAADRQGCAADQYAQQLLAQHLPATSRQDRAVALLQSWMDEGDVEEQTATLDYLIQALDADRLSDRALFPPELQGKSW
jgi:site-specific recombinase